MSAAHWPRKRKKGDAKDRVIKEKDRVIAELRRENAELREQVAALLKRVAELEAKLKQNSTNSSKPPSSDPPDVKKPKRKRKSGRAPGGQPGHDGKTRELLPPDEVDEIHDHKPACCRGCGGRLRGADPSPRRHQVTELPPVRPLVFEHRLHALPCTRCGEVTRAELPEGVSWMAFGPKLQAVVAVLGGAYRLSKRNVQQLLSDLFGVEAALGSITALEGAASAALAAPVEEAKQFVREQPSVNLDETGWRHNNRKSWLWTAATALVAVFLIRFSRASKVAKELVGEGYAGIAGSDRWSSYSWIDPRRRQLCWAHLKRDFQKFVDLGGSAKPIGEALLECEQQLFRDWHRVRDGTLKRSSFRTYASRVRVQVRDLLRQGAVCDVPKVAGMCKKILGLEGSMWTFVRVQGIEPTNNAAERALRPAVIWRKTSFGTKSDGGRLFAERMLTVVASLRLQGRNVVDYVSEACHAAMAGLEPPSLLPERATITAHPESTRARSVA